MKFKRAVLGLVLIAVPGSGIVYGSFLIYKALKKRPKDFKEWIDNVKKEFEDEDIILSKIHGNFDKIKENAKNAPDFLEKVKNENNNTKPN